MEDDFLGEVFTSRAQLVRGQVPISAYRPRVVQGSRPPPGSIRPVFRGPSHRLPAPSMPAPDSYSTHQTPAVRQPRNRPWNQQPQRMPAGGYRPQYSAPTRPPMGHRPHTTGYGGQLDSPHQGYRPEVPEMQFEDDFDCEFEEPGMFIDAGNGYGQTSSSLISQRQNASKYTPAQPTGQYDAPDWIEAEELDFNLEFEQPAPMGWDDGFGVPPTTMRRQREDVPIRERIRGGGAGRLLSNVSSNTVNRRSSHPGVPSLRNAGPSGKRPSPGRPSRLAQMGPPRTPPSQPSPKSARLQLKREGRKFEPEKLTITTTIAEMKRLRVHKDKFEMLFEIYAVVDSEVTEGKWHQKEFLLRDEGDSVWTTFYEIDSKLPELGRGHWVRVGAVMRPWGFQAIHVRSGVTETGRMIQSKIANCQKLLDQRLMAFPLPR